MRARLIPARCPHGTAKTSFDVLVATGEEKTPEDAVKIAARSLVVEHKGLCTMNAENQGQAIGGAGDGV